MLKTMKSKVVAVVAAFVLVSGASVAFGASDAGQKLREWYDAQFGQATANIEADAMAYIDSKKDGLEEEFDNLKNNATNKINSTKDAENKKAMQSIAKDYSDHLTSIINEKNSIEKYMNSQFERLKEDAEQEIFDAGTAISNEAHEKMEIHTSTRGSEALGDIETSLTKQTNTSVTRLRATIEDAKSELQVKLDNLESTTTEEIKGLIDKRIGEIRIWVTSATNYMVQEQTEAIEAKALELENAAKKAMQDLVDGI